MPYSLRQARNFLGSRVVREIEDEDIEVLFEDLPEERDWYYKPENNEPMEKARAELIHLIREWMSFHGV